MDTQTETHPGLSARAATAVMAVQAALAGIAALLLLVTAGHARHPGLRFTGAAISAAIAIALGICADHLRTRSWAWAAAMLVEGVVLLNSLLALGTRTVAGLIGVVLAVTAASLLALADPGVSPHPTA